MTWSITPHAPYGGLGYGRKYVHGVSSRHGPTAGDAPDDTTGQDVKTYAPYVEASQAMVGMLQLFCDGRCSTDGSLDSATMDLLLDGPISSLRAQQMVHDIKGDLETVMKYHFSVEVLPPTRESPPPSQAVPVAYSARRSSTSTTCGGTTTADPHPTEPRTSVPSGHESRDDDCPTGKATGIDQADGDDDDVVMVWEGRKDDKEKHSASSTSRGPHGDDGGGGDDPVELIVLTGSSDDPVDWHICPQCRGCFSTKEELTHHMSTQHSALKRPRATTTAASSSGRGMPPAPPPPPQGPRRVRRQERILFTEVLQNFTTSEAIETLLQSIGAPRVDLDWP